MAKRNLFKVADEYALHGYLPRPSDAPLRDAVPR
jgi:hypothetical protein